MHEDPDAIDVEATLKALADAIEAGEYLPDEDGP